MRKLTVKRLIKSGLDGGPPAWIKAGYLVLAAIEAVDLLLSYSAWELLLQGNLTGAGLFTDAERAAGLVAGVEALCLALVCGLSVLIMPSFAGKFVARRDEGAARSGRAAVACLLCLAAAVAAVTTVARYLGQTFADAEAGAQAASVASQAVARASTSERPAALLFSLCTLGVMGATVAMSFFLSRESHSEGGRLRREVQASAAALQRARGIVERADAEDPVVSYMMAALASAKAEVDALVVRQEGWRGDFEALGRSVGGGGVSRLVRQRAGEGCRVEEKGCGK